MGREAIEALARVRVRPWHLVVLALVAAAGGYAGLREISMATSTSSPGAADALTSLAWCGALAFIGLLGLAIFVTVTLWRAQLAAMIAMWRSLAIVGLAAYLLFFNDQCRELGVSLMIGDGDWWRAFFLLIVLVYWALNNWHSARLGLWGAARRGRIGTAPKTPLKGEPDRKVTGADTPWIFWGPRLLGVCAHLLAAASLGVAALRQPEFGLGPIRYFAAASAVLVIAVLTYCVYRFDRSALSSRAADPGGGTEAAQGRAWDFVKFVVRRSWLFMFVVTGLLLAAAVVAYLAIPLAPPGFVVGSLAINESAVVYLTFISAFYHGNPLGPDADPASRRADDAREARNFRRWTLALCAFGAPFVVWTLIDAPAVGRTFGSMVIALFTFGALLSTVNGLELATAWTGRRLFGERARPRVFHAYATAGVIALCFANAWLHPFHAVRRCEGGDCGDPGKRLRVQRAAQLWYDQARLAYAPKGKDGDKTPMLIVATAGGGIRAAYWTATVLDTLEREMAPYGGARPYLFAISGVSGGSVGAAAFSAALADHDRMNCQLPATGCLKTTSFLADDYFAPTLAAWIFKDTLANLSPFPVDDRQVALERGFEHASNDILARPFLSFFNPAPRFETNPPRSTWSPILFMNATHEETGKRIIASQVLVERDVFVDAYDELDMLGADVSASTAALNSARFTYVSPAGDLGGGRGSVIDGGYYENYGAQTALELANAVSEALRDKVKIVILMITSDPTLGKTVGDPTRDKSQTLVRIEQAGDKNPCVVSQTERDPHRSVGPNFLPVSNHDVENAWINEFVAPLQGLMTVREAHGKRAAFELAVQICADYVPEPIPSSSGSVTGDTSPTAASAAQMGGAEIFKVGRGVVPNQTEPTKARSGGPYFAHVGMCERDRDGEIAVHPPLGWVLSQATRRGLDDLVKRCGNREQLDQLEVALKPLTSAAQRAP